MSENKNIEFNETPEKEMLEKEVPESAVKTACRLFGQLKNQRVRLLFVAVCIIFYVILNVYTPYYSAGVIDRLMAAIQDTVKSGAAFRMEWNALGKEMFTLSVMYILLAVFYHFQGYLMASVAEGLILTLREQISHKLNKLPLRFFDNNKPGEILSRVTSDLDKVSETLQTGLLKLITSIGTLVGTLAFMFYYSWILTLAFLAFTLISLLVTKVISKKNLECSADRQEGFAYLTGLAEEYYTGRDVIRAYNHEAESVEAMNEAIEELRVATRKTDFLLNCVNPLIRFLSRASQAMIMLTACSWMLEGTMTIGVVQAFFQYINLAAEPLTETSYMINSLQSALASAERTFQFIDAEEEVPDIAVDQIGNAQGENADIASVWPEHVKGEIAFHHISFGYTPDKILMKNIDFEAKPGQKIAVVGSTGAGKTTLINLLMRFYELNNGEITLDGIPTTEMSRKELRRNFGMVLQDTWLFGGSVAENIAYGKPDATMDEIKAAAKAAKVDYFIRTMPHGYDTILDNEAGNLSVGQRQLITIARVFLCNPAVIILDEATSSVDTRTEVEISKAMKTLMKGRTSFVIAHRLSTIRDADIILFMENGNIIEQGNHHELLEAKGAYAELYNSQFA